jgi:hypothetical protein
MEVLNLDCSYYIHCEDMPLTSRSKTSLISCTVSTLSAVIVSAKPEILMKFRMNENDYFS